jgi:hypothetical protein
MKKNLLLTAFILIVGTGSTMYALSRHAKTKSPSEICPGCMFNGKQLWGKVQVVDAFPDVKVQIVDAFSDVDVQVVDAFPDACGKWQMVDAFPDVKIQFVDAFPDVKIRYVDAFPGCK